MKAAEAALWLKDGLALAEHQCEQLRRHGCTVRDQEAAYRMKRRHGNQHTKNQHPGMAGDDWR